VDPSSHYPAAFQRGKPALSPAGEWLTLWYSAGDYNRDSEVGLQSPPPFRLATLREELIKAIQRNCLRRGDLDSQWSPQRSVIGHECPSGDTTVLALFSPVGWERCR
jgi:hypothetical protein